MSICELKSQCQLEALYVLMFGTLSSDMSKNFNFISISIYLTMLGPPKYFHSDVRDY